MAKLNVGDKIQYFYGSEVGRPSLEIIKGKVIGEYPYFYLVRTKGAKEYFNVTISKVDLNKGFVTVIRKDK